MKLTVLALCAVLLFAACTVEMPTRSMEASMKIRVECRDDPSTRRMVITILKQAKARDIVEQAEIHFMVIEASYYESDNTLRRLQQIVDQLTESSGVVRAEMNENRGVIRQNR